MMKPLQCIAAFGLTAIVLLNMPQNADITPQNKLLTADIAISSPFQPLYTDNADPATSIRGIAQVCGLDDFISQHQTNGCGIKVAIIDSGLDVGLDEFSATDKIMRYLDFTSEGRLSTRATSRHQQQISAQREIYHIGELPNALPQYKLATFQLDNLLPIQEKGQMMTVMLTASTETGYDTIYIDTDNDCDFTDERPLRRYNQTHDYLPLAIQGKTYHLILTDIATDGSTLQLSGDFLGHGTFIAGIIAANSPQYQGLAPQAQLYIYKIFDHCGVSDQAGLAKAIHTAITDDVDIINLSLSLPSGERIEPALLAAIDSAKAAGIPIIAAAGNYGSSLGGLAFPANQSDVLSAGSYIAPIMHKQDLGLYLEEGFIPAYSARGNKHVQPTIVAPGAATSTVPAFFDEPYMYDEGTSAASAVTTAAIVHLQQYARDHSGQRLNQQQLNNILALTAADLQKPNTDQGYGLLNMHNTAKVTAAQLRTDQATLRVSTHHKGEAFTLTSQDGRPHQISWQNDQTWLTCDDTHITADGETTITPQLAPDLPPGHYSTWLKGTIDDQTNTPIYLPINHIKPYPTDNFTNTTLTLQAAIGQGESRHYYLQIAPHTQALTIDLAIATSEPTSPYEHTIAQGRCRMQLYAPDGSLSKSTPYIGASYSDYLITTAHLTADKPQAGIWQLTVTSSDWLSMYNHFLSNIQLKISARQ